MRPTNYHLFDFLDFDVNLQKEESLWKAYRPTAIYEKDGDICLDVPFQKQMLANDMAADLKVAQEIHRLYIRYYEPKIIRLFIDFTDEETMTETSEMLQFNACIQKKKLSLKKEGNSWQILSDDGIMRAFINLEDAPLDRWSDILPAPQESIDIRLFPDGDKEIRLAAYDHFSPPRYDALPLAFCKSETQRERATLSFECQHDECFGAPVSVS